ncbi:MAG: SprT-like domain-containing protein [Acidobacteriota bacterium]
MSAFLSRLRQLDLFLEDPPSPAELLREQSGLQARYDSLAALWKLPPARIVLTARRATGGVITYGPPHVIRISSHMSREDRLHTLLHETAHAICFAEWGVAEGHSPRFWSLAKKLGVARKTAPETERLRRVREANARYAYRCPGCTAEWTRRTPFGRARLCASCERAGRPARLILVRRPKPLRRASPKR